MALFELRGIDQHGLDDPARTLAHKQIILSKPFLKRLYVEWYRNIAARLPQSSERVIELGSGGGFLKDIIPHVTTSDILSLPDNDLTFDALAMPFADGSVDAFVMVDVFHHVPDSERFLREMRRALRPGGRIIMSEPATTLWSTFIYRNFHHEPFEPRGGWTIPGSGPMSDANGALPYIVFERDRSIFEQKFPELKIISLTKHTPLRYLLSGGVSRQSLVPTWSYDLLTGLEWLLRPVARSTAMFELVVLEKRP